jgi:YD repeat-containing protein
MRRIVPAIRRALVVLLVLAVGVLGMVVVPDAQPARAAAGDPVSFAYDDAGRLVGATDPVGDTANYSYDPVGNLTSIDRHPSSQTAVLAFSPRRGPAGTAVTISGTGFSATAASNIVKFNGTTATVTSATTTRLVATVPAGATSGTITVTAPGGAGTSSEPFTVAASPAPTISGFSPTSGVAGTVVTISGTNFDTAELLNNVVAFNHSRARVTAATSTTLTVEVPGATGSGSITVRTPNGTAVSSALFAIPPPSFALGDLEMTERITVGTGRPVSVTTAGKIAMLVFDGTAGQRVSVRLTGSTFPAGAGCFQGGSLALLKPDGSTLGATDLCSGTIFLDAVTLPVAGTYTVLIDPKGTGTGSATMTVFSVTDVTGTVAADGSSTSFSLTTPGQNARYSFTGNATQRVNLTMTGSTIGGSNSCLSSNGALAILKPDGTTLGSTSMCKPTTNLATQTLPAAGSYTVLVNPAGTNTGSATVTLSTVTTLAATRGPAAATATPDQTATSSGSAPAGPSPTARTTKPAPPPANPGSPEENWAPDRLQLRGDPWLARRPATVWQRLSPLTAPAGTTAVAGQTLTLDGQPLVGVTLRLEGKTAKSDDSGRFVLAGLPSGRHVLVVDGRSASRPGRVFGVFEIGVDLASGKTTALPAAIWMPRLDTTHTQRLIAPTAREVVLTTPKVPGLEVRIPAGSTIRDSDGKVVRELGITAIPVDRAPFPTPAEAPFSMYFTVQPGGAYIFPEGARIIYPNHTDEAPGTRVDFWQYDPKAKGWHEYGKGTVTADGKQIIPDPGVRVYGFTGASFNVPGMVPAAIAAIKDAFAAFSGDPVDMGTGLLVNSHTDLYLPDTMPISITRTYRQSDSSSRAFGIGTNFDYGIFLHSQNFSQEADLVLPDSSKIHFVRIAGTGHFDGEFEAQNTPTIFYKSRLVWNGWGWNLKLRDGTVYVFGSAKPLQAIRDRYGNQITLTRTNGQGGNITQITSPNGKWIKLSYDTSNRITRAEDNTGRAVVYTYDTSGRLAQVTGPANNITKYTYNASHQLTTITDARDIEYLTNEYDANGRIKKQTQADQSTYQFAYTLANGKVTEAQATDPRGHVRKVSFDSGGYVTSDTAAFGTPQAQTVTLERQAGTNFVTAIIDQLDRRTTFDYDANGNVTSMTRLAGTAGAQTVGYATAARSTSCQRSPTRWTTRPPSATTAAAT